jgi:hypothetical protein
MRDDTVRTSWKRLTDKVKNLWGESVGDTFAETYMVAPRQTTCGAVAPEELPAAPTAIPHADSMSLKEGAAPWFSAARTGSAAAGCRTDRDGEAIREAARLATWEDEGGMPSS